MCLWTRLVCVLQAAELYEGEEQTSTSNTCKLKVAQFAAKMELYVKAVELFEAVAMASLDNNLLKYSVKVCMHSHLKFPDTVSQHAYGCPSDNKKRQ